MTLPGARDNVQIVYECAFASVGAAWRLMLERGKSLADKYGVKPEDLILGQWSFPMYPRYVQSGHHSAHASD